MSPHTRVILKTLQRIQHRTVVVLAVQYACASVFYVCLGLLVCGVLLPLIPADAMTVVGAGALGGSVAAAVLVALGKRPALAEVAAQVDGRLHLQQRLQTALECLRHQDQTALLLHRDASQHIRGVQAAHFVPWRFDVGPRSLRIGACIVVGLALLIRFMPSPGGEKGLLIRSTWLRRLAQNEGTRPTPPAPRQAAQPRQAPVAPDATGSHGLQDAGRRQQGGAASPVLRPPRSLSWQDDAAPASAQVQGQESASLPPVATDVRAGTAPAGASGHTNTGQVPSADRTAATGSPEDGRGTERPADSPGALAADSEVRREIRNDAADRAPTIAAERPESESGPEAAGPPSGRSAVPPPVGGPNRPRLPARLPSSAVQPGMGPSGTARQGTGEGVPLPLSGVPEAETAVPPQYRSVYERYRTTAEEVMAREHMPPGLRQYIRGYFVAIHP